MAYKYELIFYFNAVGITFNAKMIARSDYYFR